MHSHFASFEQSMFEPFQQYCHSKPNIIWEYYLSLGIKKWGGKESFCQNQSHSFWTDSLTLGSEANNELVWHVFSMDVIHRESSDNWLKLLGLFCKNSLNPYHPSKKRNHFDWTKTGKTLQFGTPIKNSLGTPIKTRSTSEIAHGIPW